MRLVAIVLLLALPPVARAYDSMCFEFPDTGLEPSAYPRDPEVACTPFAGPNTARHRWIGALDEHRRLWERTRELSGIPDGVSATAKLRVFTAKLEVPLDPERMGPTLMPNLAQVERVRERAFTPGELAQLPDFSYALWDWAQGHETCPLEGTDGDPIRCHDFATHMGPVNSNHFLPQSQHFYTRYHTLAVARAQACGDMKTKLGANAARFDAYLKACEIEALALEAVGQHYLQDAWSMGHMWERWGGPELTDFPEEGEQRRARAVLVALVSGLFHGARGVLQKLPDWTSFDVNDAMNAPHEQVKYRTTSGAVVPGIGDDYIQEFPDDLQRGTYAAQARSLFSCAVAGMREVYGATGQAHGPMNPRDGRLVALDPASEDCFGQRATNAAMLAGAAIQVKVAGGQIDLPLNSRVASWMIPQVGGSAGEIEVPESTKNHFRVDLGRIVSVTRLLAKKDPNGVEAATGRLGALLGAKPNSESVGRTPIASYGEPDLPWPATADAVTPDAQKRADSLGSAFHRAHAADWCSVVGASELTGLRARVNNQELDTEGKAAACEACSEFASRHLRIGSEGAHDTTKEPLCRFLTASPAYVYQAANGAADATQLARAWCGCP